MNFEFDIAKKLAIGNKKAFANLIIKIAIAAVAISLSVMIISSALISGFKHEISDKIFGFWGHIHITDTQMSRSYESIPISKNQKFYPSLDTIGQVEYITDEYFDDEGNLLTTTEFTKGGVSKIQSFTYLPGIISTKSQFEGIVLKGIDENYDWNFIANYLTKGNVIDPEAFASGERQIVISSQSANRLSLDVGDEFIVHFVIEGKDTRKKFKVVGMYRTGLEEYDQKFALIDVNAIRQLLDWSEDLIGGFEVYVDDLDDATILSDYIYVEHLPGNLYSESIRQKFPNIFDWLDLQDINLYVILLLMLLVSIINMATALLILILEHTNVIGVLKAMGSSNWSIRKIFLYYAAYIVGLGLFWGNLIGISISLLQKKFKFIKLKEADYYLSYAPIKIDLSTILALNLGALLLIMLVLIIPSYLVSRIQPVKALRFN